MEKPLSFAILNHAAIDSGTLRESATQRLGIIHPTCANLMCQDFDSWRRRLDADKRLEALSAKGDPLEASGHSWFR
jgi:hypothetical protein